MCGIIAVLRRRSRGTTVAAADLSTALQEALSLTFDTTDTGLVNSLTTAADALSRVNTLLTGTKGIRFLHTHAEVATELETQLTEFDSRLNALEGELDERAGDIDSELLERINAALVSLRDASWAVRRDRLRTASTVIAMAGETTNDAAIEAFASVQTALSSLDRLEVRGRDSAGLHLLVTGHGLDAGPLNTGSLDGRADNPLFESNSVRAAGDSLSFVYKCAAEIGELGDNVAALRAAITEDTLLHRALAADSAEMTVLGHTRWASVGIISEANAHPLNQEEADLSDGPYVVASLNGDVDNHLSLVETEGLDLSPEITTDAKVIPCLVSRRIAKGTAADEAFRQTVASFEGSVAIGLSTSATPDRISLALFGSGQALYIGLSEDAFVVASEPYGVVEECQRYLRMDGDTPGNPDNPTASRGQIVHLERKHAGEVKGITRLAYDGTVIPIKTEDLSTAAITTRDIDRGTFPHFLLKEITEAPRSFRKTLRGKIVEQDGLLAAHLGEDTIPASIARCLADGTIRRILTIGQGTAAIAATGCAAALVDAMATSEISIATQPATELSGFHMREDMSDTLIIAISQSGTTTDTNRTVDLVRGRGAQVIAIVNRRGSDLTDKADGVLYTSDGRDVEMSVASTKAFYAQIAAGFVLAYAIAQHAKCCRQDQQHEIMSALRELPTAMEATIAKREAIGEAARKYAPSRRYWAVVGNGKNRIAAEEIRIKLSELCYKAMACDATEDKKHIDLSSEPLILVCAAGLTGSTADDVSKEIAIYRAHQALPIVFASEGEDRFDAAYAVIQVPHVHPTMAFVLSTVVGHLFGYEAAKGIDLLAHPLRQARAAIERLARTETTGEELLCALAPELVTYSGEFSTILRRGCMNGQLEANTAVQLSSLLRYACGLADLENYQVEHSKPGTPAVVIDDLTEALTDAIEQLTRPVDAIKHQAKTVTVGISRSDESLLTLPLVKDLLDTGAPRERISYADLRALAAIGPTLEGVLGFSRYSIEGDIDNAVVRQIDAGGIAAGFKSRTADNPTLKGTKHLVARERTLFVARGGSDSREVIIVPETQGKQTTGITLMHVRFKDHDEAASLRSALSAYRNRFSALQDAVTETQPEFDTSVLEQVRVIDLFVHPVHTLADHWRK